MPRQCSDVQRQAHPQEPLLKRYQVLAHRAVVAVSLMSSGRALSQQDNPVYVDDSPQAREMLRQARDQTRENAGEAVRLYQELLDEFPLRLAPVSDVDDEHFTAVRRRVIDGLLSEQALLDRYRLMQTPVAEHLLQTGELDRVAMSYPLTEPGLEAMLRLAQRQLEAGRFHAALAWLDQARVHPDFAGRRAAHGEYMAALALHDLGRSQQAHARRDTLKALGTDAAPFMQSLDELMQALQPAIPQAVTALDTAPPPALTDVVPQAIWTMPMEDSLIRRRFRAAEAGDEALNEALQQRLRDADLATAAVTVVGPLALVNQGHTVTALDRLTGREEWSYQDISRLGLTERGESLDALDLNVVSVDGDSVVTLTGHAQANRRSDGGRIVCLEAADGSTRWSSRLTGIIETAADEELFAHGAPVILEGRVYVMARKVTTQLLTSAFVVALDLSDGGVLWCRHLASSGGLRIAARPFDSIVACDGGLYVASAVGASARFDPTTGETRWLRRFAVPISPPLADQTRRPWEMLAHVITDRGMVTLQPDGRRVVLLDLETGDELANHSAGSSGDWNSPRYLLSDGPHVFAIGSDIRGFNVDALETPAWRLPAPATQDASGLNANAPSSIESLDLRGRVQLAGEHLIAPTARGVLIIDAVTGRIEQTLAIDGAGNPLAYESQMLVASGDRLDSYMSLRRAEEMLRKQMAEAPNSPDPALSLLRLGIRADNVPLALEAADRAMAAADAPSDDPAADAKRGKARIELFEALLELARRPANLSEEQGEAVFARLQASGGSSEQRVNHLLVYGDWLASRSLPRAIETWQTILSEPELARTQLLDEGLSRPASTRAIGRIAAVLAARGPSVYAPQADFASLRLASVQPMGGAEPDVAALDAIVREFPFAAAAVEGAILAADARANRGDMRGALAGLLAAYRASPQAQAASRLLGRFVDVAERAGWRGLAADALAFVRTVHGDIEMEAVAGSFRVGERLALLQSASRAASRQWPRLGPLGGQALTLGASVIPPARGAAANLPTDRVLLRDGNSVRLVTGDSMEPKWSATVEGASPQVLRFDEQAIVLWFGADPQEPHAVRLDPADGAVVWTTPAMSEIVPAAPPATERVRVVREQMPNGDSFDPQETLALAHRDLILLIMRSGAMAAIDVADGRTVRWSSPPILSQVHLTAVRDGALALSGMVRSAQPMPRNRDDADAQQDSTLMAPRLLVLDPETGRPAFGEDGLLAPLGLDGIKWMTISPLNAVVYGSEDGLEAVDLLSGERLWSNGGYAALDTQRGWCMHRRVVIEDQRRRLRSVAIDDGALGDAFELPLRGEWDPMELRDLIVAGDAAIGHYRGRVVIYDPATGRVIGADAVPDDRDFRWLVRADDRLLAVSTAPRQVGVNAGNQPMRRTQYDYTVYPLSFNGKALGQPTRTIEPLPERVQQVTAIDNWLLLSTLTDTLAVPMPADQGQQAAGQ